MLVVDYKADVVDIPPVRISQAPSERLSRAKTWLLASKHERSESW